MLIYSLVTARSGSKEITDKNIIDYNGFPLIYYSINVSLNCKSINRTFVSTDSEKYASISKKYGAEVPFIRPSNLAQDLSTDLEVFQHFIDFLKNNNEKLPDLIIHLRPTYPNRNVDSLNKCIHLITDNFDNYDSLRTVCSYNKLPQKMYYLENNKLIPFFKEYDGIKEPYNMPRQLFKTSYIHNGCIDIIKTSTITELNSLSGQNIYPFIMDDLDDIDNMEDLEKSKKNFKK